MFLDIRDNQYYFDTDCGRTLPKRAIKNDSQVCYPEMDREIYDKFFSHLGDSLSRVKHRLPASENG
ncbi:MAG: hypothetical protein ABI171_07170 [Collimonas sp.]|uniref:hypothetical protein n=1 Tax=Collimonas sp. TaxID=1963772 RepID=UPI00326682EC